MALYNGKGQQILINSGNASTVTPSPDFSSLSGKYCLAIGDSYTYALAGANGALTSFNTSIGMAGTYNHGIVSSTIRDKSDSNNTGYAFKPISNRVLNQKSLDSTGNTITGAFVPLNLENIGYITVMGGTNDSYGESSIGKDLNDGDRTHIYGATNLILQKLIESYPNIPIIVILQPPCANNDSATSPEGVDMSKLSKSMKSVAKSFRKQKAIREVAEVYANAYSHVKVVDCCFNWYSPLVSSELSTYWQSDLLHLTSAGYSELVQSTKYDSIKKALSELFTQQ